MGMLGYDLDTSHHVKTRHVVTQYLTFGATELKHAKHMTLSCHDAGTVSTLLKKLSANLHDRDTSATRTGVLAAKKKNSSADMSTQVTKIPPDE